MSKMSQARAYADCAKQLTADTKNRKSFKRKALSFGVRAATFLAAETVLNAIVVDENIAGALTVVLEPIIAVLSVGEELAGGFGSIKLAGCVGRKFDEWYDRTHPENVIEGQVVPSRPAQQSALPPAPPPQNRR